MRTTKADLIQATAAATGRAQTECRAAIEQFLAEVFKRANAETPVEIRGFGVFYTKERKPRPARNPRTGKVVPLPRRHVFLFRYSPDLKTAIAAGIGLPLFKPARFENIFDRRNIAAHARAFIGEEK